MPSPKRDFSHLSELITQLYDAALDETLWSGMATQIAEVFGSSSAVLKLHGQGERIDLLECTDNLLVSGREQAWADDWHRRDLWVERSVAYGMSRVITDEDLVTCEEQAHSGFYQEWLRHLQIYHLLGAVFPAENDTMAVLGIHRAREAGAYTLTERQQAALFLPHLQRALRLGQRLAAVSRSHSAAWQALDCLDSGVLVVDAECAVIHASAIAETMLHENTVFGMVGRRLLLRQPALQERLLSLVRDAADTASGKLAASGEAFAIRRARRLPLVLEVAPLRPSVHFSIFDLGERPAALIFIRDPEAPLPVGYLRELFGLTRIEAAIAAELAQGVALAAIAVRMDIALSTVRSHLKSIFAKTGTHRQAELVALLARSISGMAGRARVS